MCTLQHSMILGGLQATLLLLILQALPRSEADLTNAGPYIAKITHFEACDDEGTNEVKYGTRLYKGSTGKTVYRSNWTWPYPLDEHFSSMFEVSKWGAGGWGRNFYNFETKNYCEGFKELLPKFFISFFSAMDAPTDCPIPAGTYYVKDWNTDLTGQLPFAVLPFGKYRVDSVYFVDGHRVGCWRYVAEITQKFG